MTFISKSQQRGINRSVAKQANSNVTSLLLAVGTVTNNNQRVGWVRTPKGVMDLQDPALANVSIKLENTQKIG